MKVELPRKLLHWDSVVPLLDVWEQVAQDLEVSTKDAARVVERLLLAGDLPVWWREEQTGFYYAAGRHGAAEDYVSIATKDLFDSAESKGWLIEHISPSWRELAIPRATAFRIRESSMSLRGRKTSGTLRYERLRLDNAERAVLEMQDRASEATQNDPIESMLKADALVALTVLWFELAEQLRITPKQAADLVERLANKERGAPLYGLNSFGFYSALGELDNDPAGYWFSAWNAANDADWSREWCFANLSFLGLTTHDAGLVRAALGVLEVRQSQDSGANCLDPQHPRYAPKLAAALRAWMAVDDLKGKTPKQLLVKWLSEHADEFGLMGSEGKPNEQGIEECAKVANWRPLGGAPTTPSV